MDARDIVQTIFTLLTLLSDYLVAFDLDTFAALLIPPDSASPRADPARVLWVTLLYSSLEPAAFTFLDLVADSKPRSLLVDVFVTLAVCSSLVGLGSATSPPIPVLAEATRSESRRHEQPLARPHSSTSPVRPIATVPFITCAAFANASLQLYARHLDTTHSRDWFDRSAAGWSLAALLCLSTFFAAKAGSYIALRSIAAPGWRTRPTARSLDIKVDAIVAINLLRAAVRSLLFASHQRPFTGAGVCRQGAALCLLPGARSSDDEPNLVVAAFVTLFRMYCTFLYIFGFVCLVAGIAIKVRDRWYPRDRSERTTGGETPKDNSQSRGAGNKLLNGGL